MKAWVGVWVPWCRTADYHVLSLRGKYGNLHVPSHPLLAELPGGLHLVLLSTSLSLFGVFCDVGFKYGL